MQPWTGVCTPVIKLHRAGMQTYRRPKMTDYGIHLREKQKVKNYYEVSTTAFLRGEAPFAVTFHVSNRSGRDLFFNMFIEGVNLLLTERTEIGALIDRNGGDLDAMISQLRNLG